MNKQTIYTLIGVALIVAIVMLITSTTSNNSANKTKQETLNNINYTEELNLKEDFVEGCNFNGEIEEYCSCTYDYVVEETSKEKLIEVGLHLIEEDTTQEEEELITSATNECLYLIGK